MLAPLHDLFRAEDYPNLLVGLTKADDAAVYRVTDEIAIIHTIDFFTPIVDDPYQFGAIAAANALSDVYAMGGEVLLALNVCAFPADMSPDVISRILLGGADKVREAGGVLAGGHTVDDPEPKYGLSVLGVVHPRDVRTKAGAQPGDALVLTKPLGVGIITTAFKGGVGEIAHLERAAKTMAMLNQRAARVMQHVGVHAATDITGFGLLGHSSEMAALSQVELRFHFNRLPFLEGAQRYAREWLFPAGANRNQEHFGCGIAFASEIPVEMQLLLFTPETSGGLLIAVPAERLDELLTRCADAGQTAWHIGEVIAGNGIVVLP
jgi:selenide,water dikinase